MLVFVAPFPALSDQKDGLVQRVASIDALVSDRPRIYLDISFRRFWLPRRHFFDQATVWQINGLLHFAFVIYWLRRASVVYVHSVYNALKALPSYWMTRTITDMHGVVPEELAHEGKRVLARIYDWVENISVTRSLTIIHVTSAMKRHFENKYGRDSTADHVIAILPGLTDMRGMRQNVLAAVRDPETVIYAGGLQAWQNVPKMIEAAVVSPHLRFVFLSGNALMLHRLAEAAGIASFRSFSVEPDQVPDHYLTCNYGFVLRDAILLNQVACPTKLVEYLYWGVIPIVLTPKIGDFAELGFAFVGFDDFCAGRLPDETMAARMRIVNRRVVESLRVSCERELSLLRQVLRND